MGAGRTMVAGRLRPWAIVFSALVFVQMLLGAFMAGLGAGRAFEDWPTYGGRWIPPGLFDLEPWWINHFENPALVHFQHRTVAYGVALLAIGIFVALRRLRADKPVRIASIHVLALTSVQVLLGIVTVTSAVALPLAALHQICALALFASALWLVYATGHKQATS